MKLTGIYYVPVDLVDLTSLIVICSAGFRRTSFQLTGLSRVSREQAPSAYCSRHF